MKSIAAGFSSQTPVTIYDKTKPYIAGRAYQKTISSVPVIGPPLTGFMNVFADAAIVPLASETTPNGRIFVINTVAAGIATIALYTYTTGMTAAPAYVGKINVLLPNQAVTTHTLRYLKVYDGASSAVVTGWKIAIGTLGSVAINGGAFVAMNIALADFVPVSSPTIGMALANNAKAVYFAQDPALIGANNTLTVQQGGSLDRATQTLYVHNGLVAATSFAAFDLSQTPTVVSLHTAVVSQTTSFGGTSPVAYFSTGAATTTMQTGDPVVFTATAPANFSVSAPNVAPTAYFARDIQTVGGVVYFNLGTTSGGAAIVPSSAVSGMTLIRAFGVSTAFWLSRRTGTIVGFSGAFLVGNSETAVVPSTATDPNIPAALSGQSCVFLATATGFYLFKASDIQSGVTSLPSLDTRNIGGTGTDYTAIVPLFAIYSASTGMIVYVSNSSQFYAKRFVNSAIALAFGGLNTTYLESMSNISSFSLAAITNLDVNGGILYLTGSTVGQRRTLYMDFRSDSNFAYSFTTSPVIDTTDVLSASFIQSIEKLFDLTSSMVFSYKTATTFANTTFDDPTTGWTVIPTSADLSAVAFSSFSQLRVDWSIASGTVNTPAQINELYLMYTGKNEISSKWEGSVDNTSSNGVSPAYTAFRQTKTDSGTKYFRAYDDSGVLVASANTSSGFTSFDVTTDNGTTWTAMPSANAYSATPLTTEIRYRWVSPPGVRVTCSLGDI